MFVNGLSFDRNMSKELFYEMSNLTRKLLMALVGLTAVGISIAVYVASHN
jgi:uncharacterized membrane protein YczE